MQLLCIYTGLLWSGDLQHLSSSCHSRQRMLLLFPTLSSSNVLLDHLSIRFREWIISCCPLSFSLREAEPWGAVQQGESCHSGILGFSQTVNYSEALVNEVNYSVYIYSELLLEEVLYSDILDTKNSHDFMCLH